MERESIKKEISEIFERMSSPEYTKRLAEIENVLEDEIQLNDIDDDAVTGTFPDRRVEITGHFVR